MQHNTNTHIYAENFKNFIKNDEVGQFMFNGLKGQARFLKLKYTSEEIDIAIENCFAYWQEKGATNWLISTPQEQFAKVSRWLTNDFAKTKASKSKEKTPIKAAEYEVLTPEIELSQFNEIYPPGVYSKTFLKHWLSFDIFFTQQEADSYQQQLRDKTVSDERKQFLHNAIRKKYLDYLRRTIAA